MKDLRKEIKKQTKTFTAKDPIEQVMDDEDTSNITLYDEKGSPVEFEQIARIELDGDKNTYVILIPVTPIEGVQPGEGVAYSVNLETGMFDLVVDEKKTDKILEVYEQLISEG